MATQLIAYHGKQEVKESALAQVAADEAADRIIQGHYWDGYTGCTVGCLVRGSNHFAFESLYGIDVRVAIWADIIHEGLSEEDSKSWTRRFMEAVVHGTTLEKIHAQIIVWFLADAEFGLKGLVQDETLSGLFGEAATVYEDYIGGQELDTEKLKDIKNRALARDLDRDLEKFYGALADKLVSLLQSAPMAEVV